MKFTSARSVEDAVWTMLIADLPRGSNRSLINDLFNGMPPYTDQEVLANNIDTNVNFLEAAKIAHDARSSLSNAFQKTGNHFTVRLEYGPPHKRLQWGRSITRCLNRILKNSLGYVETLRSTFASMVLHGIGPVNWPDQERWAPEAVGVEDLLIPTRTLLSMDNLEFFALFRQYTPAQLYRMTHSTTVSRGWNMALVREVLNRIGEETFKEVGFTEKWFPEKLSEQYKEDLGFWARDSINTVDCWDFYFLDEDKWRRRMILDFPTVDGTPKRDFREQYLFDGGSRSYADSLGQIVHFQFADASAVAPFRYHSVRSLGFMLYAVCQLQNRLRCKFNDAVFESLLWYFRVNNPEDAERLQKIDLHHLGILPEGLEPVLAKDRYQIPAQLIEAAMAGNRQSMSENSASYVQDYDFGKKSGSETATEVMAKVNSSSAMVGSMLNQAYIYQKYQYDEICRRFCIRNNRDPDVREFRQRVMKEGVPENMLDFSLWTVEAERVLGAGNKTLEMAQVEKLMAARNLYDPESQREILYLYTEVNTDNPGLAARLVPMNQPRVSDSVHDAELSLGTLMQGFQVSIKKGMNHIEYVDTMLKNMALVIQKIERTGGQPTEKEIMGLDNLAQHIQQHIQIIAQDPNEKQRVKVYGDDLGKLMNLVRGYAQRLAQQRQKEMESQQNNEQMNAAMKMEIAQRQAQQKLALDANKSAVGNDLKQRGFELQQMRKTQQHQQRLAEQNETAQVHMATTLAQAEAERVATLAKAQAQPESEE